MPFYEASTGSQVSGGSFLDVKGDLNEHKRDDYSIHTSGKDNMVTQINRPAMINNGEGGQVNIHIHASCQQLDYFGLHGSACARCPIFPSPHPDHPRVHLQQPTFQQTNYQPNGSNTHPGPTGTFYGPTPSSSPVTMPSPSLPFNATFMETGAQESSPVQMPVPTPTPLQEMETPSASPDTSPISPVTPPYQNASEGRTFDLDEPQPGFFPPAFRLSLSNSHLETHWSSSRGPLGGTGHSNSTMSPPPSIYSSSVPLPPSPQQERAPRGPVDVRSSKHVSNMKPPSRSYSENHLFTAQRDNVPNLVNQNVGRLPMIPEHRRTVFATFSSEKKFIGAPESRSSFPLEPSRTKERNQEGGSGFDIIPPKEKKKHVRSMTEIVILPNPWD